METNNSKKIITIINLCQDCPNCKILPDPDPDDWFCDDDVKIFCTKLNKTIASSLRPYEVKDIKIPEECPLN